MKKSDGKISSLDSLLMARKTDHFHKEETRKRSKTKYLLLLLLIPTIIAITYLTDRLYREAGSGGKKSSEGQDETAGTDISEGTESPDEESKAAKLTHKSGFAGKKARRPKVIVIEKTNAGGKDQYKGPVNFGTSLQIVAPK